MSRYRVLLPLTVHTEDGAYTQGQEFEKEFTVEEEQANLTSGLLEVVQREYKVVGEQPVFDTSPGETVMAGLSMSQEATLLGSHLELVVEAPKRKRRKASDKE